MKKLFKIGFIFILLFVLAIGAFAYFFNANQLRPLLIAQAEKNLHARVELGSMNFSVYPYFGFTLHQVEVFNQQNAQFKDLRVVSFDKAYLGVSVSELLKRSVVAELILDQPKLWYQTAVDGTTNLELLLPETKEEKTEEQSSTLTLPSWIKNFEIKSLQINHAFLTVNNQQSKQQTEIKALTFHVSPLSVTDAKKAINFSLSAQDIGVGSLKASGTLHRNAELKAFQLEQGKLQLNNLAVALAGSVDISNKTPAFSLTANAPHTDIAAIFALAPSLQQSLGNAFQANGEAAFHLALSGTMNAANVKIKTDFKQTELKLAEQFHKAKNKSMQLELEYQGPALEIEQGQLSGTMSIEQFQSLGANISAFSTQVKLHNQEAQLQKMNMQAFDGNIQGSGVVTYETEPIKWNFELALQDINTNKLLTELADYPDILLAKGNLQVQAKGSGVTEEAIKKSLTLGGNFSLKDGELKSLNFSKAVLGSEKTKDLLTAFAIANKLGARLDLPALPSALSEGKSTRFKSLTSPLHIKNGKVELPTLNFNTAFGPINLAGNADLDAALHMQGNYTLNKSATESWLKNATVKKLLVNSSDEIVVPLQVSGNIISPHVEPNFQLLAKQAESRAAGLAKAQAKEELKDEVKKVVPKEQKEQVKEKAKKVLQGWF